MALILSESFAAGVPSGFATIVNDAGSLSATWHASGAVDLVKDAFNGAWRIDASPTALDLRIVMDVEQLSADNGGSSGSGFGVGFRAASETPVHTFWFSTEGGSIARYFGTTTNPITAAVNEGTTPWPLPSLAGRKTIEWVCVRSGSAREYQVRVDGVLVYAAPAVVGPLSDTLEPWLFVRDASYRLHQIDIYDDAVPYAWSARLDAVDIRLPPRTWAPVGYRIAGQSFRYDSVFGGRMRLAGFTEIDGTPPTRVGPRRVLILDQLSGRLVRETWSDSTGAWEVTNLANGKYLVITPDPTLTYDPAALSDVVPAAMP